MNKFGVIKTKLLNKLTEAYAQENKSEVRDILNTIKENKDFKELYLFYEEIENKYIDNTEVAKLYVEGLSPILKSHKEDVNSFIKSLSSKLNDVVSESNEIYESLDILSENDNLNNIEKKVKAKMKLVEHLTTKKEIKESKDKTIVPNETLLNAVLANNFNVLYSNTLSESEKEELKNILSIPYEELITKSNELKESVLNQVQTMLTESNDDSLTEKLRQVRNEVQGLYPTRYNYYRLNELKNGLK